MKQVWAASTSATTTTTITTTTSCTTRAKATSTDLGVTPTTRPRGSKSSLQIEGHEFDSDSDSSKNTIYRKALDEPSSKRYFLNDILSNDQFFGFVNWVHNLRIFHSQKPLDKYWECWDWKLSHCVNKVCSTLRWTVLIRVISLVKVWLGFELTRGSKHFHGRHILLAGLFIECHSMIVEPMHFSKETNCPKWIILWI